MKSYVEYSANNSGGSWWLTDENWQALEKAGWKVAWATLEFAYDKKGSYIRDEDGTPKLVPVGQGNNRLGGAFKSNSRYLGALAKYAYKAGATSIREAAQEWETITGQSATDAGCACCGPPHSFTLYQDGKWIESGPSTEFIAKWD